MKLLLQFTEAPRFIKQASKILDEDEIENLQLYLIDNPLSGVVIQGSGGIRKLRWASSGRGKRGGSRVIYFFAVANDRILLMDIYTKNDKDDLSHQEVNRLRSELESWLDEI